MELIYFQPIILFCVQSFIMTIPQKTTAGEAYTKSHIEKKTFVFRLSSNLFPQDCALCGEIYSFPACLG